MKKPIKHPQLNRKQPKYNKDQSVPVRIVAHEPACLTPQYECQKLVKQKPNIFQKIINFFIK